MLGRPVRCDALEQLAPALDRRPPPRRERGVAEPLGPELPEDANVAGAEVLAEIGAGLAPFVRQRLRPGEQLPLALEQAFVLDIEDGGEKLLLATEVVVDERELHAGALGDRTCRRPGCPVFGEHVAGRRQDQQPGVVPAGPPQVLFRRT